jgi:hypothetical protein
MAVEGLALFDALEAFHLPNMEPGHQRALIWRTLGRVTRRARNSNS